MALTDNIISYWKFDESSGNAADSVTTNDLTNNGTTPFAAALINNGADFGTGNSTKYFSIASNLGITGGAFSCSLWIKVRTEPATSTSYHLFIQQDTGTDTRYDIIYQNDDAGIKKLLIRRMTPGNGGSDVSLTYDTTLGTTVWRHLVWAYNGTTLKGYLDNTEIVTSAASGNGTINIDSRFWIGAGGDTPTNFSSVYVDEVGTWSRVLTVDEISELYNSGNGLQYPFSTSSVKTWNGLAIASRKTHNGLASASVKTVNSLA